MIRACRAAAIGASSLTPTVVAALLVGTLASHARAAEFSYLPPGDLIEGSGDGRIDDHVYAAGIRFPMEKTPAFANSQVYNAGGFLGPAGGQCDDSNYSYPWRDNYCETRSWDMPLCPAGTGHQGQDIRAATCEKDVHWVVAATDGTITSIGSYSVYLTAADGTRYDYLHMGSVQVAVGEKVKRGQQLGRVSNEFGGTPTSIHLHFNIRQNVQGLGSVYVPPYLSLVAAYEVLVDSPPLGALEVADCTRLRGYAYDPDTPDLPLEVEVAADGEPRATVSANEPREDLCELVGACDHGFEALSPYSLFDGAAHELRFSAVDAESGLRHELLESPQVFTCESVALAGVRRPIDAIVENAWSFSPFWDEAPAGEADIVALPFAEPLDEAPRLVALASDPTLQWLLDGGARRSVDAATAKAWRFRASDAQPIEASALDAVPERAPWPARPLIIRRPSGEAYLLDVAEGIVGAGGSGTDDPTDRTGGGAGCACAVGSRGRSPSPFGALAALGITATLLRRRDLRRAASEGSPRSEPRSG